MKKIVTIIGARPQFIKASAISRLLQKESTLKEIIVHTGQHYDTNMSQVFLDELDIPTIAYQLGIGSGTQGKQTGEMLTAIEAILMQEKPDYLLIYGDTNSTLAGALAAVKLHIPIAHVEAGLRSYNRVMPEEINRIVADQVSDLLFAPTEQAVKNLKSEGFADGKIHKVGDVMYDVALFFAEKSERISTILEKLKLQKNGYILATIHRAENTNDINKLISLFTVLESINETFPIIMPLHPRTRKLMDAYSARYLAKTNIHVIEPIGFLDMVMLEKNAALIMTDSGGVQKEAFFYKIPCITLRSETEWVETVHLGWNTLVDPLNTEAIYQQTLNTIGQQGMPHHSPYGTGNAAQLVIEQLNQGVI